MGEAVEEDPELEEDYEPYDEEILVAEGMNGEGLWAMQEAYREQDEAYAALQVAKQTLREARAKQKFVKLSRQYYGKSGTGKGAGKSKSKGQSSGSRDDSAMQCLACGKIGHRAANCPKPSGTEDHNESAPFVCYLDTDQNEALMANSLSTQDAITAGMAVIDGGATKTVASVAAVEALMDRNQEVRGTNGLRSVDTGNRPTFSFGNSSANQCVSTAQVAIRADGKPGTLNIHAISQGQGPILLSVATLRALGAIIDFEADLVTFRKINASKVLPVQRSASGHQLLPLASDLLAGAHQANRAVPSLREFLCKDPEP